MFYLPSEELVCWRLLWNTLKKKKKLLWAHSRRWQVCPAHALDEEESGCGACHHIHSSALFWLEVGTESPSAAPRRWEMCFLMLPILLLLRILLEASLSLRRSLAQFVGKSEFTSESGRFRSLSVLSMRYSQYDVSSTLSFCVQACRRDLCRIFPQRIFS